MKQMKAHGRKLLCAALIAAMVLAATACGGNASSGSEIESSSSEPSSSSESSSSSSVSVALPLDAPESETIVKSIADAYAVNSDVVGWLYLPNTDVNNEVLHYNKTMTNADNQYYLRKNLSKAYDWYGCYFADFENKFGTELSRNTIIYGHSMDDNADGLKFSQLKKWLDPEFAKSNPYIYFSTPEKDMVFKIFSVMYTTTSFNYVQGNPDNTEFMNIINEARKASEYNYDVDVKAEDKIITLSTCTYKYGAYPNPYRYVIMGRLVRAGEEMPDSLTTLEKNPTPTPPTVK